MLTLQGDLHITAVIDHLDRAEKVASPGNEFRWVIMSHVGSSCNDSPLVRGTDPTVARLCH